MAINASFKYTNIKADKHLEDYFWTKVQKVERILKNHLQKNEEICFYVELAKTTAHHQKGPYFYCEINLNMPRRFYRAQASEPDIYRAIDRAISKLERELTRGKRSGKEWLKERLRNLNKFVSDKFVKFKES